MCYGCVMEAAILDSLLWLCHGGSHVGLGGLCFTENTPGGCMDELPYWELVPQLIARGEQD